MFNNIKKYWQIILFIGAGLWYGIIWVLDVDDHVENAPTAEERKLEKQSTNLNNAHATEIRQMRYEDAKKMDSIKAINRRIQDSLTIDAYKRFTVQIEQIKEQLKDRE